MKITKEMTKVLLQELKVLARKYKDTEYIKIPDYVIIKHVTGLHMVLESKMDGRKPLITKYDTAEFLAKTKSALLQGRLTDFTNIFPDLVLAYLEREGKLGDIKEDVKKIITVLASIKERRVPYERNLKQLTIYDEDAILTREQHEMFGDIVKKNMLSNVSGRMMMAPYGDVNHTYVVDGIRGQFIPVALTKMNSPYSKLAIELVKAKGLTEANLESYFEKLSIKANVDPSDISSEIFKLLDELNLYLLAASRITEKIVRVQVEYEQEAGITGNQKQNAVAWAKANKKVS